MPESANSLLLRLADATVIEVPLAFNDPPSVERDPTVTLLKLRAAGDAESCPTAVAVPESGIASDVFDAVEVTVRFPLAAPALVGLNVAVKVTLWFAESVIGRLSPLMEKPAPVTLTCEMVMDELPVFVSDSERLWLFPTWMLPNTRLLRLGTNCPAV